MKYSLIFSLLFSTSVFAVGIGNDNPGTTGGNVSQTQVTNVSNRISNSSRANAAAFAAGNLTTTDVRTGAQNVSVAPNSQSVSVTPGAVALTVNEAAIPTSTHTEQSGTVSVRSVPNVITGNVYPTAPCMGSTTIGASWLGGGAAGGTSWTDDECSVRETARSFQNMNLPVDALAVLCTSKYAAAAPSCNKNK